jgi:hypothetical protein
VIVEGVARIFAPNSPVVVGDPSKAEPGKGAGKKGEEKKGEDKQAAEKK